MNLEIPGFDRGDPIPWRHCFMVPDVEDRAVLGPNRSPELRWANVPEATRSFAVILMDPDAPFEGDLVNQEGQRIPYDLPRADFHHWVLVDIPADRRELPAGAEGDGVVKGGKKTGPTDHGRRGRNDFTAWFEGDEEMEGVYGGYDGPAPPWNDERLHHYHFKLYALDVERLDLPDDFDAAAALERMEGHVLAEADYMGTCTLNAEAKE